MSTGAEEDAATPTGGLRALPQPPTLQFSPEGAGSALGSSSVEVGVDLLLADIFGDSLLVGHSLGAEADPLHRNSLLLNDRTLLVQDNLVLLFADVRARTSSADVLIGDWLPLNPDLLAADRNSLGDILGHNVLPEPCASGFFLTGADLEPLL